MGCWHNHAALRGWLCLDPFFLAIPTFMPSAKPQNTGIAVRAEPVAPAYGKTLCVAKAFPHFTEHLPIF